MAFNSTGSNYGGYPLAGMGNPATGQQGLTRSQVDPGYTNINGQLQQQYTDPSQTLGAMWGAYKTGVLDPSMMYGQAQINDLERQKGLTGLQSDLQSQIQNQQAGWQLRGLGLEQQGLGVQQGALARQMSLLPQQYGLQQQQFGVQGARLDEQTKEAWQNTQQQQEALKSQATAAGTGQTPGTQQGMAHITQGLQNALTNIGFGRQDLGINKQQAALTFQEQQAQQQDSKKMLDIQSQKLGLSGDEIRGRLQNALNQIGISNQISVDQLLSEQYKVSQGELSQLSPFFGDLYSAGGITVPSVPGG